MHNSETVLENETQKVLWDFEIQTDHLISTTRTNLVIVNKKKKQRTFGMVDFAAQTDHRINLKESKKIDKYLKVVRQQKMY